MRDSVSPITRQIAEIKISGPCLPRSWMQHIKLPSGCPDYLGMLILSDLVYWYTPSNIIEDDQIVGQKDKFYGDMLQRNHKQIAADLGCSEKQAKDALSRLCSLGLVKKVVRSLATKEAIIPKVMYLLPCPEAIKKITSYVDYKPKSSIHTSDISVLSLDAKVLSSDVNVPLHVYSSNTSTSIEEKNITASGNKSDARETASADSGKKESSTMLSNSAPPTSPKTSSKDRKGTDTDSLSSHPTIQAFRKVLGRYPNKTTYVAIIKAVGEKPLDETRLAQVVDEWLLRGYSPTNYAGMIAWYHGGIDSPRKNSGTAPGSSKLAAPANSTSSTQEVRVLTKEDIDKIEAQQRRLTDYFPPTWRKGFEAKVAAGKVPGMALAPDYYQNDK